jgi:hypothetical protein
LDGFKTFPAFFPELLDLYPAFNGHIPPYNFIYKVIKEWGMDPVTVS